MELKQIQITGGAKEDYDKLKNGKKRRSTRKQKVTEYSSSTIIEKKHVGGTSPGTLVGLAASSTPTTPGTPPPQPVPTAGLKTNPEGPAPVSAITQAAIPTQGGAKPKTKVELAPAPKKKEGMKLAAPKAKHTVNQTRKARKIKVSISGLNKRMTRHKKIQKQAKLESIESIKKKLMESKLIKAESKAPESMLRQIYADYETLKNKAL